MAHILTKKTVYHNMQSEYKYYIIFDDGYEINISELLNLTSYHNYKIIKINDNFYILNLSHKPAQSFNNDYILYVDEHSKEVSVKFAGYLPIKIEIQNKINPCILGIVTDNNNKHNLVLIKINENNLEIKNILQNEIDHNRIEMLNIKFSYYTYVIAGKQRMIAKVDGYNYNGFCCIYDYKTDDIIYFKSEDKTTDLSSIDFVISNDFLEGKTDFYICEYKVRNKWKVDVCCNEKILLSKSISKPFSYSFSQRTGFLSSIGFDNYLSINKNTKYIAFTNSDRTTVTVYIIDQNKKTIEKVETCKHINDEKASTIRVLSTADSKGQVLCLITKNYNDVHSKYRENLYIYNVNSNQILTPIYDRFYQYTDGIFLDTFVENNPSISKYVKKHKNHYIYLDYNNLKSLYETILNYCIGKSNYYIFYDFNNNQFNIYFDKNNIYKYAYIFYVDKNCFVAIDKKTELIFTKLIFVDQNNRSVQTIYNFKNPLPLIYNSNNYFHCFLDGKTICILDKKNINNFKTIDLNIANNNDILIKYIYDISDNIIIFVYVDSAYDSNHKILLFNFNQNEVKCNIVGEYVSNYIVNDGYFDFLKYPIILKNTKTKQYEIYDKNGNFICQISVDNKIIDDLMSYNSANKIYDWLKFEKNIDKISYLSNKIDMILNKKNKDNNSTNINKLKL